jgi:hypothetical protein
VQNCPRVMYLCRMNFRSVLSWHGAMLSIKATRMCSFHCLQVAERAAFMRFMVVFTLLQFAFAFSVWAFYSNLFALFAGAPPTTALYVVCSASLSTLPACRGWAACCCIRMHAVTVSRRPVSNGLAEQRSTAPRCRHLSRGAEPERQLEDVHWDRCGRHRWRHHVPQGRQEI